MHVHRPSKIGMYPSYIYIITFPNILRPSRISHPVLVLSSLSHLARVARKSFDMPMKWAISSFGIISKLIPWANSDRKIFNIHTWSSEKMAKNVFFKIKFCF